MSFSTIDEYLDALPATSKDALMRLRRRIRARLPSAQECISYGMPGFRENGRVLVGFAAFKKHLSWFPHSGQTLNTLANDHEKAHLLDGYDWNAGTLRFEVNQELPDALLDALIEARRSEAR